MSGFGVSLGQCIRGLSALAGLCLGILMSSGCARSIGDGCINNTECSSLGDRYCDVASPGGYCTVEGCDQLSCPDSSLCVRFFSLQKGRASCDVSRQVRSDCTGGASCCKPGDLGCCKLGERCLCDEEGCGTGYCASEASERRYCMKPCDANDDCRDGYQCVSTGSSGAIPVSYRDGDGNIVSEQARYCAPPK